MTQVQFSVNEIADLASATLSFLGASVLGFAVAFALFRSAGCRWPKGLPIESPEKRDALELFYWTFAVVLLLPPVLLFYPEEEKIYLSALVCGPLVISYISIFYSNHFAKKEVNEIQHGSERR